MPVRAAGNLKDYLATELPQRTKKLGLLTAVNQQPDAIIEAGKRWLARIELPADAEVSPAREVPGLAAARAPLPAGPPTQLSSNLGRLSEDLVHTRGGC